VKWISKSVEEKKLMEGGRSSVEEKWTSLKAYHRARGLCFTCGERWGKEHQCQKTILLHIELVLCMQDDTEEAPEDSVHVLEHQLLCLSAMAVGSTPVSSKSLKPRVVVQGHSLLFLVDSGSSSCFLDQSLAGRLSGRAPLPTPVRVQVAGGEVLHSTNFFPPLTWSLDGHYFTDNFRIISLNSYDGIVGHDWLAKLSPMITHSSQHWLAIVRDQ
jgi:hypothetical protein